MVERERKGEGEGGRERSNTIEMVKTRFWKPESKRSSGNTLRDCRKPG